MFKIRSLEVSWMACAEHGAEPGHGDEIDLAGHQLVSNGLGVGLSIEGLTEAAEIVAIDEDGLDAVVCRHVEAPTGSIATAPR